MTGCEEDIDLCIERKPIPVIYSILNKYDTVNYVYVTRTWSGDNGGTMVTAKNPDSIYFRDVQVDIELIRYKEQGGFSRLDTLRVSPPLEWIHDKHPGIFANPDCPVYVLRKDLTEYNRANINIQIPGYRTLKLERFLQRKPTINFPGRDGMEISIQPVKALVIDFSGGAINEVKFQFEVIAETDEGTRTDTIVLERRMKSGRTTITYDFLRLGLLQQLKYDPGIQYRKLGKTHIEIWTAFGSFPLFDNSEFSSFNNDYTLPYSPQIPEFFIYGGTIGTNRVVNLNLDYLTREAVANDTTLRQFRFVRW